MKCHRALHLPFYGPRAPLVNPVLAFSPQLSQRLPHSAARRQSPSFEFAVYDTQSDYLLPPPHIAHNQRKYADTAGSHRSGPSQDVAKRGNGAADPVMEPFALAVIVRVE